MPRRPTKPRPTTLALSDEPVQYPSRPPPGVPTSPNWIDIRVRTGWTYKTTVPGWISALVCDAARLGPCRTSGEPAGGNTAAAAIPTTRRAGRPSPGAGPFPGSGRPTSAAPAPARSSSQSRHGSHGDKDQSGRETASVSGASSNSTGGSGGRSASNPLPSLRNSTGSSGSGSASNRLPSLRNIPLPDAEDVEDGLFS